MSVPKFAAWATQENMKDSAFKIGLDYKRKKKRFLLVSLIFIMIKPCVLNIV